VEIEAPVCADLAGAETEIRTELGCVAERFLVEIDRRNAAIHSLIARGRLAGNRLLAAGAFCGRLLLSPDNLHTTTFRTARMLVYLALQQRLFFRLALGAGRILGSASKASSLDHRLWQSHHVLCHTVCFPFVNIVRLAAAQLGLNGARTQ